jgi:sulfatase modifying factor 1
MMALAPLTLALFLAVGPVEKGPIAPEVDLDAMVEIPAGTFQMGIEEQLPGPYGDGWFVDQQPAHAVTLGTFRMDRHEVAVVQFALFLSHAGGLAHFHVDQPVERVAGGYLPIQGTSNQPMRQVTWQAAEHYCLWAGKRLPSEAEWERAAAGPDGRGYPWPEGGANCARSTYFTDATYCNDGPLDVGSRPEGNTESGIADLAGNVSEWTGDWYDYYPNTGALQTNPAGAAAGQLKVVRGGGFLDGGRFVRTRARRGVVPALRSDELGFRCAWSQTEAQTEIRGALGPPEDIDRQASPRPYAPPAPVAEVLAQGLVQPMSIVSLEGTYFVGDDGTGAVVALGLEPGETAKVVTGLAGPILLAVGGTDVLVVDAGGGTIGRLDADLTLEPLITDAIGAVSVAGDGAWVFWATLTSIHRAQVLGGGVDTLASGLDGVMSMALNGAHLYFTETGAGNPGNVRVARVPVEGGPVQSLVGHDQLGDNLQPTHLVVSSQFDLVFFPVVLRGWPQSGMLGGVSTNGGQLKVYGHSPPGLSHVALSGSSVVWATKQALSLRDVSKQGAYDVIAPWTRVGGVLLDEGHVIWTDRHSGRVYRTPAAAD